MSQVQDEPAKRRFEALGQLAAGVAHEINNPLGFIRANIDTLEDYTRSLSALVTRYRGAWQSAVAAGVDMPGDWDDIESFWNSEDVGFILEDAPSMLTETREGAVRATNIVGALKTFARGDTEGVDQVALNDCVKSALLIVHNELKYHCTIVTEYGDVPLVRANFARLDEAIVGVLLNAGLAITERGTVTVKTGRTGDEAFVSVQDDGVGMDENTRKRAAQPFFTTRKVGEGQGMGLSVASEVLAAYGGRLSIESAVGEGTTVTIFLPAGA